MREGEVVGIAGVQGNGQTELVEVITGLATASAGSIEFSGADITRASVARHSLGIAHIPEDRHKSGMVGAFTVAENIVLNSYYDSSVTNGVQIDWQRVRPRARACVNYDVRTRACSLPPAACREATSRRWSWHASSSAR